MAFIRSQQWCCCPYTQALDSAAKEALRMLYYMPGLGRQINKLDTDKAILAAPDYQITLFLPSAPQITFLQIVHQACMY